LQLTQFCLQTIQIGFRAAYSAVVAERDF